MNCWVDAGWELGILTRCVASCNAVIVAAYWLLPGCWGFKPCWLAVAEGERQRDDQALSDALTQVEEEDSKRMTEQHQYSMSSYSYPDDPPCVAAFRSVLRMFHVRLGYASALRSHRAPGSPHLADWLCLCARMATALLCLCARGMLQAVVVVSGDETNPRTGRTATILPPLRSHDARPPLVARRCHDTSSQAGCVCLVLCIMNRQKCGCHGVAFQPCDRRG